MGLLALLLRLSIWVAAANALFIWEACRVDGTCEHNEGRAVGSRPGARHSEPVTLEIHQRTAPVRIVVS